MSYQRQYIYDPRAESPPLIERLPTPPNRVVRSPSWDRSQSPPLVTRIPTPPYLGRRSFSPPAVEQVVKTIRTRPVRDGIGSRVANFFRPRQRTVQIIQTPIHRTQSSRVRHAPSPPPAVRRRFSLRRSNTPPPPPTAPLVYSTPPSGRRNRYHGMSPRLPDEYVPLPPRQPLPGEGEPTPPRSKERSGDRQPQDGRSPRPSPGQQGFTEYHPNRWRPQEQVDEEPRVVINQQPVRSRTDIRENEEVRGQLKRVSRELEKTQAHLDETRQRLSSAEDRARRASSDADRAGAAVDELRRQLRTAQQQAADEREKFERERSDNDRLSQELEYLRRTQGLRETVIHHDPDRPAPRPVVDNPGMQAIREAQAHRGRGRGGRGGGLPPHP